ncbi:TonB-dependent receptor [Mucilaginibacter sp. L196]|uniref:SusC/RagA family TonB-linked outer membrane protein n=1 Tax=Mucilaginibacter sp. L196 TaxID=1641870 RepID=UPI00131E4BC2|nr:TonB-dependent receptor [Mucilaginibacter sp. L196]
MRNLYLLIIVILACLPGIGNAQTRTVTGTVTEKGLGSLPGTTVRIKGGIGSTQTDANGKYTLKLPATGSVILAFSSVGYKTVALAVPENLVLNVQMEAVSNNLDEVVAIGYATVKRKDVTGASVSVSAQDLELAPVTTAAQALTGKAAGVSVITQSGAPGAASNIVIRGGSSITQGGDPLYIVDGFQMQDALRVIDINDIATIDILKDASATSIYGARGSNGVILITTKSAKSGKTEISYNGYYGFETLGKTLPMMNELDYTKYQYELQTLQGIQPQWASYFGGDVTSPTFGSSVYSYINSTYNKPGIDWQKLVFGSTAPSMNHNFSISSGTDKTLMLISYNNTEEDGILSKHNYLRNGVRLKLNHEVYKNLHIDFNTSFQDTRVDGGGSLGGTLKETLLQPPTGGVRYTDQQLINTDVSQNFQALNSQYDIYNPTIMNNSIAQTTFDRLFTVNGGVEWAITKDFKFHSLGSYNWDQTRADYFDSGQTITARNDGGPYGSENTSENFTWQITNTLNWNHNFHNHDITVLVGQETDYSQSQNLNNTYYDFPADNFGLNNVGEATGGAKNTYGSGLSYNSLASFFGRASYNYKDKYILNVTLRADGSSNFGPDNKWGYFPSVAGAWRISDEDFMKNQSVISDMKLRVGYGTAGNDNIGAYHYTTGYGASTYAINNNYFNTLVPGNTAGNPNVKWEKTASTNIGLDIGLLKGRFNLTVDVYNNKSDNLLIDNQLNPASGYTNQYQNIGAIANKGLEFVLTSNNLNKGDFRWKTSYNMSFNRSKVLQIYGNGGASSFISDYGSRIDFLVKTGQPLGQFYGYQYAGVYTTNDFTQNANGTYTLKPGIPYAKSVNPANVKPGDIMYKTTAGQTDANGTPVWSTADRTIIGSAEPKFTGGMTNTFNYKGFDCTIFVDFSYGNKIFNMNAQRFMGPYLPNENVLSVMNGRYTLIDPNTGQVTTNLSRLAQLNPNQSNPNQLWSLSSDNVIAISDANNYYLQNGSYLRLSTITLGYTLPARWANKIKMKRARLYCTLDNVYTFTGYKGYDPEVSATSSSSTLLQPGIDDSAYPRVKSVVFGLNVTF